MRVWLDDERAAPEGWVHVQTPEEAIELLRSGLALDPRPRERSRAWADRGARQDEYWDPAARSRRQNFHTWVWLLGFFPIGLLLAIAPPEGRYRRYTPEQRQAIRARREAEEAEEAEARRVVEASIERLRLSRRRPDDDEVGVPALGGSPTGNKTRNHSTRSCGTPAALSDGCSTRSLISARSSSRKRAQSARSASDTRPRHDRHSPATRHFPPHGQPAGNPSGTEATGCRQRLR